MVLRIAFSTILALAWVGLAAAQPPDGQVTPPASAGEGQSPNTDRSDLSQEPTQGEETSNAEKIARLQRTIEEAGRQIDDIRARLSDPENEYRKAEADFSKIDHELEDAKVTVERLKSSRQPDEAASLESTLPDLQRRRELAKQRFDLAIEERKVTQQQLATLEQKLQQDREALAKLTEPVEGVSTEPSDRAEVELAAPPAESKIAGEATRSSPPPVKAQPSDAASETVPTDPAGQTDPKQAPPETTARSADSPQEPPSEELVKAQDEATTKETAARDAEQVADSVTGRLEKTQAEIDLVRKRLTTARQQADNARETERTVSGELQRKWDAGAPRAELDELRPQIDAARERYGDAVGDVRELSDRLDELQSERDRLQTEQIAAMQAAEAKRSEADEAQKAVEHLQNPFAPANLLRWLVLHGPTVLLTIAGMFVVLRIARVLERRLVRLVARTGVGGSLEDRENRAKTLVGVLHNAARVVVIGGGLLMIAAEVGVDIYPLLGGAAVLGLAVAFGAQNLVRDYFYGFIILMENQYTVNDVIKIGNTAGLVERITLRMTVLRDLSGTVHFVPHGNATTVSNMTHGWSRAVFEIGVAYKEDVNRVMEVLMDLGREIRRDPDFASLILDDPEMLGLDEFGDSAVVIKFFIKTRPLKQWAVKRELQRRIKIKFDELGIELPFPHRTVYHIRGADDATSDG